MSEKQNKNRRFAMLLGGLVVGMFGFGFAMVPLYDLFCQVTGIQSVQLRTEATLGSGKAGAIDQPVIDDRLITVKFDGTVNSALPWEFKPLTRKLRVRPGEVHKVKYLAHNLDKKPVSGQAIPSVVPWQATNFFNKIECFCFTRQTLQGGGRQEMPLVFSISPDLPEQINSLTLSYTFMNADISVSNRSAGGAEKPLHPNI